jgi:hypothetical protein
MSRCVTAGAAGRADCGSNRNAAAVIEYLQSEQHDLTTPRHAYLLYLMCSSCAANLLYLLTALLSNLAPTLCNTLFLDDTRYMCCLCVCCSFLNEFIMTFMFLFLVNMMTAR